MFMRMIYDDKLAQAAYLIGCQRTGEAILIDPQRDVDRYIDAARRNGLRITAVAETHIHADFLSGSRELAERTGAKVYLSDEGGPDWTYEWVGRRSGGGAYDHQLLHDGDTFQIGQIEFKSLHTPGHTPEHIAFLVTDRGGGAAEPMGIATGDFVFVGDLGRPDLLETAAGQAGAKEPAARQLFASARRFLEMPDYLQVWPAHGAGSACGKALGAVPQTTVGYEKRVSPALRAATDERRFVDFILSGQPEPPLYFARMKRLNKIGPALLGSLPQPRERSPAELTALDAHNTVVIDTRPWTEFRAGHLPGALWIPLDNMFPAVAGSYVDDAPDIVLLVEATRVEEAVRDLVRIGLDRVTGFVTPDSFRRGDSRTATTAEIDAAAARDWLRTQHPFSLDVRSAAEFATGHIDTALNIAHTQLPRHLASIPKDRPILVNCRSGARSARACAYLQRAGYDATNLAGGILAWDAQSQGAVR